MFIDWIKEQPRDRTINHASWSACAVGDYLRAHDLKVDTLISPANFPEEHFGSFDRYYYRNESPECKFMFDDTDDPLSVFMEHLNTVFHANYGDLQDKLEELGL